MRLLSAKTKRIILESTQTFLIALFLFGFAIALTFLEDWCLKTQRPIWLTTGIEIISMVMFFSDALVVLAICVRVLMTGLKENLDSMRDE
jgi:hypothetical protein